MAPEGWSAEDDERVEILERTTPFQGYFRIDRYRFRHRKHEGGWTGEVTREVFERGHAAGVLPWDPLRDEVVLIEQFRAGALAARRDPWLIETVAGIIGEGETPEEVVRREAVEEAGCEIGDLEPLGEILLSPGGCSETLTLFLGRTSTAGLGGVHGLDEEDEDIRVLVTPFGEAMEMIASGRIANANAILPLQWLALNRERMLQVWNAQSGP